MNQKAVENKLDRFDTATATMDLQEARIAQLSDEIERLGEA